MLRRLMYNLSGPQDDMNPRVSLDQFRHLSDFKCVCSILFHQHNLIRPHRADAIQERALSLNYTHLESLLHLARTKESKIPTLLCT
jgi:hypothetical protein